MRKEIPTKELIRELQTLLVELNLITGDIDPMLGKKGDDLLGLEKAWGIKLPPSYGDFLTECNGFKNFSYSYDMLGTAGFLGQEYAERIKSFKEQAKKFNIRLLLEGIFIGLPPEDGDSAVILDITSAPDERGEYPVVIWNWVEQFRMKDFNEFLCFQIDVTKDIIKKAKVRANIKS